MWWLYVICIFGLASPVLGMPKPSDSARYTRGAPKFVGLADAAKYLRKYGYVSETKTAQTLAAITTLEPRALSSPIRRFQRLAGIKETGMLDRETMRFMTMSRCGVEDTVGAFSMGSKGYNTRGRYEGKKGKRRGKGKNRRRSKGKSRTKRYDLQGSKWEKKDITYAILNWSPDMTQAQVRSAMKKALNMWAAQSSLKFKEISDGSRADIKISFGKHTHGDSYPFDGSGGTLAHAFFPQSGEAHFDDDENFSHRGQGTNLLIVAAHEFGHSLGLGHSTVHDSLMAPFYQGYVENFQLHPDDIAAIQKLYGKKVDDKIERPVKPGKRPTQRPRVTRPTKKPRTNLPDVCKTDVDAAISYMNRSKAVTYIFKGSYFYKIDDYGVVDGYPKKIGKHWTNLPGNLDAAAHSSRTGRTYFFKGDTVFCYEGTRKREGYPKTSKSMRLPSSLRAVLTWADDGMLYMFKKKNFAVFDDYNQRVSQSRHITSVWTGLPEQIDAAFTWARNGKTYIVKGNVYWRFNSKTRTVDDGYPQNFNEKWLECPKFSSLTSGSKEEKQKGRRMNSRTSG